MNQNGSGGEIFGTCGGFYEKSAIFVGSGVNLRGGGIIEGLQQAATSQENETQWISTTGGDLQSGVNWADGVALSQRTAGWKGILSFDGSQTISNFYNENGTIIEVTGDGTVINATNVLMIGHTTAAHAIFSGNAVVSAGGLYLATTGSGTAGEQAGSTLTLKDNAVFNIRGNFVPGRNSAGTLYIQDNAVVNFNGGGVCVFGEFSDGAVCEMTGGEFNVNVASNASVYGNGLYLGRTSQFKQSGGTVTIGTSALELELRVGNNASYSLSDGVLNVSGILSKSASNFNFTGGVLSARTIQNGLTQDGGILSPGIDWTKSGEIALGTTTIQGDYALNDGSVRIEMTNDGWDVLEVTGKSTLAEGVLLDLVLADDFLLQGGASYAVWNSDGGFALPENLENLLSPEVGYYWNLSQVGNSLVLSVDSAAVPEPGTWGMCVLGGMLLCLWRKFQKKG
ncbi:MAG: hypothetical protein Q4D62_01090 [Planctomycetia bacterium]|nr:hypothetical protein [Planctomycetia bacterium]